MPTDPNVACAVPPPEQTVLYRHYDEAGALLYVGISLSALHRLAQHHDGSPWADQIATVKHQRFATRVEAHEAERRAIQDEKPKFNVIRYRGPKAETNERLEPAARHREKGMHFIVHRTVSYQPVYTTKEAAEVLKMSPVELGRLIEVGRIGHIVLGESIRAHKVTKEPTTYRRLGVTGWQILDFIEALELEAASEDLAPTPEHAP